jgi:hypothetical protein
MEGDEKVRFCAGCRRHVFNLSAMDVEEAAARVADHADGLCVRFFRRADGTLLTQDCPTGSELKRQRRRMAVRISIEVVLAVTLAATLSGQRVAPLSLGPDEVARPPYPHTAISRPNPFTETLGELSLPIPSVQAMHTAIRSGDMKLLRSFVELGGDCNGSVGNAVTPLMVAAEVGSGEMVAYLLRKGADPTRRDAHGRTALTIAREANHRTVVTLLEKGDAPR